MTEADLVRFLDAQSDVYDQVTDELTKGRKRTHWMWFIFPQLEGLGYSSMAQRYAIRDLDQARRYLADPLLGSRLRHDVGLVTSHEGKSAFDILGSPDDGPHARRPGDRAPQRSDVGGQAAWLARAESTSVINADTSSQW